MDLRILETAQQMKRRVYLETVGHADTIGV
jgi:hypothetical protein